MANLVEIDISDLFLRGSTHGITEQGGFTHTGGTGGVLDIDSSFFGSGYLRGVADASGISGTGGAGTVFDFDSTYFLQGTSDYPTSTMPLCGSGRMIQLPFKGIRYSDSDDLDLLDFTDDIVKRRCKLIKVL